MINAITNSPWLVLEDRVFIRNYLSALGFDGMLIAMTTDHEALMEQIEVYTVAERQDDHEKMINDTDLSDPEAMWQIIETNAIQSGFVDDLTRILHVSKSALPPEGLSPPEWPLQPPSRLHPRF